MSPVDTAVQNWLSSRNINVLPEWIQACLEWIHNEYQGQDLPGDQLKDMVYEQWLDSDLTEIATPSLPQGLAQQEKITIQGSFTLQINSFQDVGSSAYSQLIKIKGKENENVAVSATQATQNRFEPKPNRMLMMEITDGHQTIQAMEYQSIPALTPDTPPGTKILIQGTITCRLGVLTLTSRHVKILGGEVETLIEENNQEKLLARLLGTSLDDLPQQSVRRQAVDDRTTGGPSNQGTSRPEQSYDNKYSTSAQNSDQQKSSQMQSSSSYQISNQGFPDSVPQSAGNQRQSTMSHQSRSSQWQSSSSHHASNRVVGDINIQQSTGSQRHSTMSHQSRSNQMQSGSFQNSGKQLTKHSDSLETSSGWVKAPSKEEVKFEDDLDAIDEDILREFEEAQYQEMSKGTEDLKKSKPPPDWPIDEDCQSKPPPDWPSDEDTDEEMLAAMIDKLEEQIKARDKEPKRANKVKDSSSKGPHKTQAELKISKKNKVNALSSTAVKSKTSSTQKQTSLSGFLQPRQSKDNPSAQSSEIPVNNHGNTQSGKLSLKRGGTSQFVKAKQIQPTEDRTLPFASKEAIFKKEIDTSSDSEALQGDARKEERTRVQITTEPAMKFSSPQRTAIRPLSVASTHHPKVAIATRISKEDCSEMAAKRRRLSSGKDSTQEVPFTYLAEMMDSIRANQQPVTFVIRAFIMTLLSALGKRNDCWSLQVRLNDGSGSLDAVLSDQVLQSLIGYTVTEMKQMRLSVKNEQDKAAVEIKQKTALERCRRRLIDLCEIMTIRVNPGEEMPAVIQIRRVEQRDCQQMKQCLLP
ncbi:uncharacterized protein [Apostichopus japonicus]|uniref:uncharacterized protein isoform X2 n=1 Tax=Stichopus japonicus TaxID=307972 RepID=UPI003AB4F6FC